MFTELVGNIEPAAQPRLGSVQVPTSAAVRAQALGLLPGSGDAQAVDVFGCSCCGSGCNCSASGTWGCQAQDLGLPTAEQLAIAA